MSQSGEVKKKGRRGLFADWPNEQVAIANQKFRGVTQIDVSRIRSQLIDEMSCLIGRAPWKKGMKEKTRKEEPSCSHVSS
jgi:hypothetical protein